MLCVLLIKWSRKIYNKDIKKVKESFKNLFDKNGMIGIIFNNKEEKIKLIVILLLIIISVISTYYFHLVFHTTAMFTHFFYIPIILACIWWNRKGIFVSVFLAVNLLFSHVFYEWHVMDNHDVLRAVMFMAVSILVIGLREKSVEAQEETKLAYEKINQIFRTTGNGLRVIDKNYNMLEFNDSFLTLLGISKKEAIGKKCYEVLKGPLCHTPDCTLKRVLEGEERVECDIEKICNNGKKIFCILTATPLRSTYGEIIGIVEDLKDITDQKHTEEALRKSEERYRSFAKNFKGIIHQADINFKPIFFHGAVEAITGYTEEDFISEKPRWDQIIHNDDLPAIYQISRRLKTIPYFSTEREYKVLCKDGEIRWVEEIIQNTCNEFGQPVLIQGVIYDITERKETEQALLKSEERLLQAQKMDAIGRLAGGIAHDFNNLLTIITGNSDLLLSDLDEHDPRHNDVLEIHKAGKRATELTRQLLAFSRRQMLQPKVLDLDAVVTETEKMLRRIIGEDIKLVTINGSATGCVKADQGQIVQIIINLAVNARDAMPRGGRLTIKTEDVIMDDEACKLIPESRQGNFVCLSFEDTGLGMDKATLNQIFEPFFSTKGPGKGIGLGLSTVYGIIKQHNGFIKVYSEPNHGSIFKIYLPALSVKQENKSKDSVFLDEFRGNGEKILLVEDEEGVRKFAKKALIKNGYKVIEAANAQEALELFEKERGNFKLVLSDVVLPDQDGIQLVDQLTSKNHGLIVVLSSGYSDQKSQWPLICEKNFKFLKKPYTSLLLLQAVKEAQKNKDIIRNQSF
jgi:PAS domain S-box-containing protein